MSKPEAAEIALPLINNKRMSHHILSVYDLGRFNLIDFLKIENSNPVFILVDKIMLLSDASVMMYVLLIEEGYIQ